MTNHDDEVTIRRLRRRSLEIQRRQHPDFKLPDLNGSAAPISGSESAYGASLCRWMVVHYAPCQVQGTAVGHFHHYADADGHARILAQLHPSDRYVVMFDPPDR